MKRGECCEDCGLVSLKDSPLCEGCETLTKLALPLNERLDALCMQILHDQDASVAVKRLLLRVGGGL